MRRFILLCLLVLPVFAFAQRQVSDTIQISAVYSVTVIFKDPIQGIPNPGSAGVLIDKYDDYTLTIKADGKMLAELRRNDIPNTNLPVRTNNSFFNFILTYEKTPDRTFIGPDQYDPIYSYNSSQENQDTQTTPTVSSTLETTGANIYNDDYPMLKEMVKLDPDLSGVGLIDRQFKIALEVTNVWVDSTSLYFKIVMENLSSVPYDVNYFRYFNTYGRFSLKQSTEPIAEKEPTHQLVANFKRPIIDKEFVNIIVFDKFTLNKKEHFNIQVGEINGARQITVSISRDVLLSAKPLKL